MVKRLIFNAETLSDGRVRVLPAKGFFPNPAEVRTLLHARLAAASTVIGAASLLYLFLDLTISTGHLIGLHVVHMILSAGTAMVLFKGPVLSLEKLRTAELGVFGFTTFFLAAKEYSQLMDALLIPDENRFLIQLAGGLFYFFCLAVIYVLFIPNRPVRAFYVVLTIDLTPLVIIALLGFHHPAAGWNLRTFLSWDHLGVLFLMFGAGAMVSLYGAYAISLIREDALEARRFGQYRLTQRIGSGGMGEVWKAEHTMLARPAAIKLIRIHEYPGSNEDSLKLLRRFEREVQATAMLNSPNTVKVFDFGTTSDGTFFYVMELLDGLDLETLVERFGPVPAQRAVHFMLGACNSLAEAHHNGLVHRDIKPANVFACLVGMEYDFVKILDFGLVRSEHHERDARLTAVGKTAGTPAYMAPEIARAEKSIDERADIYSLGCVGYWLVTGQLVFEGSSALEIIADHIKSPPIPPSQRSELAVPDTFEKVILWCLEKDPETRPSSVLELKQALLQCKLEKRWTQRDAEAWWRNHGLAR